MMANPRYKSKLRSWIAGPLIISLTLYACFLPASLVGMEITAWTAALFFILYIFVDRMNNQRQIEFYTLGVEFPLLAFVLVVIAGLRVNSSGADFLKNLGNIRNFLLLFVFCYSFQVYRNLNRLFGFILFIATVVASYGIWQHFTGTDPANLLHQDLEQIPWGNSSVFASIGLFRDRLSFGHTFMMLICLPWAALLMTKRAPWWLTLSLVASFLIILTSLVFTFGQGIWIALIFTLPIMAFFASRKIFVLTVLIIAVTGAVILKKAPELRDRALLVFADSPASVENRKKLWDANMAMFHDHPWIGVGYGQNEALTENYLNRLGIKDVIPGHARSNYIELLSTTGLLGFAAYMLFILAFILMTSRLFSTIPSTHYWHRVFALAALGAQLAFHIGGLTQWNFGIPEVQHTLFFWLACVGYMSQRYYAHIVPDDHSL